MDYIKNNKAAWEESFKNRSGDYACDLIKDLKTKENPFFHNDLYTLLSNYDLTNKSIAQYCSNNGRELLQLSLKGFKEAIGFDIAENMVDYANEIAKELPLPAQFIQTDILAIDQKYQNTFDFGLITVGALCWFKDLNAFFKSVAATCKDQATLVINETHPLTLMLATKDEKAYDENNPKRLAYSYFANTVWQEQSMTYMSDKHTSATFTSYSHTLSDIFNALIANEFTIKTFKEYDYCSANLFTHINHQGVPLLMTIVAEKISR